MGSQLFVRLRAALGPRVVLAVLAVAGLAAGCSLRDDSGDDERTAASLPTSIPGTVGGSAPTPEPSTTVAESETAGEPRCVAPVWDDDRPAYAVAASINPTSGSVTGRLTVTVPDRPPETHFRVFAGMPGLESGVEIVDVTVDEQPTEVTLDQALLTVPTPGEGRTTIRMTFSYVVPELPEGSIVDALSGDSLSPADIGLLGRNADITLLGHWYPVWLPDGVRTDPAPGGFGDIGAYPAASVCVAVSVPDSHAVITGAERTAARRGGNRLVVVEQGVGLRDLSVVVQQSLTPLEQQAGGVTIRTWGPDENVNMAVADEAAAALTALEDAFGDYPWAELDVVATPLGSGVGGMEWPGMVWIEQSIFAGGVPGLGSLGEGLSLEDLGPLLGELDGLGLGLEALQYTREWTIAHEIGHQWWHAMVGNDSVTSPAIDEPLAQLSACVAIRAKYPDLWEGICRGQTTDAFRQARAFGVNDTVAEQPSDAFESSLQYGAVIYGKAPGFYLEVAELVGWEMLTDTLAQFVRDHTYELVSSDVLRTQLIDAAGDDGPEVAALWDRWLREVHGDEDLGVTEQGLAGALDGAFDPAELEDLLRGLLDQLEE